MNCLAIEQDDGILVIDAGTSFPHDDLGVDVLHPDFTWLEQNAERLHGVFVTHGHEDHIGGLPYLLDRLDVPVFGPPHALSLARRRLAEHDFKPGELDLREVHAGSSHRVGPFEVEVVRVAHSIVEASALCIETRAGFVFHTGDFNFDPDPPDGEPSDVARLEAIGERGVGLMLSDSTNIDTPERQGSEREVAQALERLVREASGRVIVAMFASNIQRLISLGEIAVRTERKICLLGRSLLTQREVASQIKRLAWPSNLVVAAEDARSLPRSRLLVLAGGTQAEPNSAMSRLAAGVHPHLTLEEGDSVVFSSRVIPGNERPVLGLMNDLLRRKVLLHTRISDPGVHTSGHAGRSEQRRMIELIRPQAFIPLHGTLAHMTRHAALAAELGIAQRVVVENGQSVRFSGDEGLSLDQRVVHGRIAVAPRGEPLPADVLKKRAELGRSGLICVSVSVADSGEAEGPPSVLSRGVPAVDGDAGALKSIARDVVAALARARGLRGVDLEDEIRRAVRRRVTDISAARPVVEVILTRGER
ncbi:MAG: ribonuclease J [Myxococcales bacterium]|nr:ribonuclease J [Myxococcales bacterium]